MNKNLLCLILILFANTVHAAGLRSESSALSADERTGCLGNLIYSGIDRVGSLDIRKLQNEVASVAVEFNKEPGLELNVPGSFRFTLNRISQNEILNEWPLLLLHKSLIALGYDDRDYKVSTGLCLISFHSIVEKSWNLPSTKEYVGKPYFFYFNSINKTVRANPNAGDDQKNRMIAQLKYELLMWSISAFKAQDKIVSGLTSDEVESTLLDLQFNLKDDSKDATTIEMGRSDSGNLTFTLPKGLFLVDTKESLSSAINSKVFDELRTRKKLPMVNKAKRVSGDELASENLRTSCIDKALREKITKIGDLDLLRLKEDVKAVHVNVSAGGERGSGGLRETAVNYPGTGLVNLYPEKAGDLRLSWNVILLHESLGALGYNDEQFQLSTGICWAGDRSSMKDHFKLPMVDYLNNAIFDSFRNIQMTSKLRQYPAYKWVRDKNNILKLESGTATSTGGGGDIFVAQVKILMLDNKLALELFMKSRGKTSFPGVTSEELELAIMNSHVEQFNDNPEVQEIQITKDEKGNPIYWIPKAAYLRNKVGVLEPVEDILMYMVYRHLLSRKQSN